MIFIHQTLIPPFPMTLKEESLSDVLQRIKDWITLTKSSEQVLLILIILVTLFSDKFRFGLCR